jgi:hypothetical protein
LTEVRSWPPAWPSYRTERRQRWLGQAGALDGTVLARSVKVSRASRAGSGDGRVWPPARTVGFLLLVFLPGCCKAPARVEPRKREFTAHFADRRGQGHNPIFDIRQGGVVLASSVEPAGAGAPATCDVHFQCNGCGVFPLVSGEQVVAPQTTNVMLSAGGAAPVSCTVTVVD